MHAQNAATLEKELNWFERVIQARIRDYFENEKGDLSTIAPPNVTHDKSLYAQTLRKYKIDSSGGFAERLMLVLALAPHVRPQSLDIFFMKNASLDRGFTEFGGIRGVQHSGFLPTGETAMFILAGNNLEHRFDLMRLFDPGHFFFKDGLLRIDVNQEKEPLLSGALTISRSYLAQLTTGEEYKPDYSSTFPATRLETQQDWEDLVLSSRVFQQVEEIRAWIEHGDTMLYQWGLQKRIKPGFKSLFYGPPGTGKTLTASLLGKSTGLDVYRIDLSLLVSKYIGETEKNLAQVFDEADRKNWILFFDEADALFGARTQTRDSKDRYANQEVAYLLQRIEDCSNVVILASNLMGNIDDAFKRRFQSMIYFPMPATEERLELWKRAFSSYSDLEEDIRLEDIAEEFELAGGAIINVVRYASLMALKRSEKDAVILKKDLLEGIRREYSKEGKVV